MKPSVLALLFALLGLAPAQAQTNFTMPPPAGVTVGGFQVVTSCGTGSLLTTQPAFGTVDITGKLCTNSAATPTIVPAVATFGSTFPASGYGSALDISGLAQPWFGLTAGGVNYGLVGVVDSTGTQLSAYPSGTFASPSSSTVSVVTLDPCSSAAKSSVPISVTSATTTSLVATSGTTTVYVCGYSFTIAPSAVTADTALIERGTGAACVTTQTALTGTYGNGDLTTAAPPLFVSAGNAGSTILRSAGTDAICLVTAGTTVNVQGVLTYVQQ